MWIASLLNNQACKICFNGISKDLEFIHRFDGQQFEPVELRLPAGITRWSWGWYQTMFQVRTGEWWMQTDEGLVRYPRLQRLSQLTHARPQAIYTKRDGLAKESLFRIYEDS